MTIRRRRATTLLVVAALVAGLLGACGGGDPSQVAWRDLTLQLPDGWSVFEEEDTRLSVANTPLGRELTGDEPVRPEDLPEGDVAAVFLTHEPRSGPGDWRRFVAESDAELEVDEAVEVGGLPATRLQFASLDAETPTRELVVVVPSRGVVLLAQPVPLRGASDGPQVFDDNLEVFDEIVASITWGVPLDDPAAG